MLLKQHIFSTRTQFAGTCFDRAEPIDKARQLVEVLDVDMTVCKDLAAKGNCVAQPCHEQTERTQRIAVTVLLARTGQAVTARQFVDAVVFEIAIKGVYPCLLKPARQIYLTVKPAANAT